MRKSLGRTLATLLKAPSTPGGKIRLLGLLGYSIATTLDPRIGLAVKGALTILTEIVGIKL